MKQETSVAMCSCAPTCPAAVHEQALAQRMPPAPVVHPRLMLLHDQLPVRGRRASPAALLHLLVGECPNVCLAIQAGWWEAERTGCAALTQRQLC